MKKFFLHFVVIASLIACNNPSSKVEKDEESKEKMEKKDNTDNDGQDEEERSIVAGNTQNGPADLIRTLISAAKSGNYTGLSQFCDPKGGGDGDVRRICDVENGSARDKEEFKEFFSTARIKGEPRIEGNNAEVDIIIGAEGADGEETISFFKMNEKWYLQGF